MKEKEHPTDYLGILVKRGFHNLPKETCHQNLQVAVMVLQEELEQEDKTELKP